MYPVGRQQSAIFMQAGCVAYLATIRVSICFEVTFLPFSCIVSLCLSEQPLVCSGDLVAVEGALYELRDLLEDCCLVVLRLEDLFWKGEDNAE